MEEVVGSIPTRSTIFNNLQPFPCSEIGVRCEQTRSDFIAYMKSSQFAVVIILITFCGTLGKLRGSNQTRTKHYLPSL